MEHASTLSSIPEKRRRILIYVGSDPKRDPSMFFLNLLWLLMSKGQARGWDMVPLIETREQPMAVVRPSELGRLSDQAPFDGIVSFMIFQQVTEWIAETGLPWMAFMDGEREHTVRLDYVGMVRDALGRLAELGCRSAGMIIPSPHITSPILEHIDAAAEEFGITVNYEWILAPRERQEEGGYRDMCSLWNLKSRPEGLVVFPDRTARGVVSAVLEKQIRVPEELRLVLHRNAESPYVVPLPCDWIEVSVSAIAEALLDGIQLQFDGQPCPFRVLPIGLVKGQR